MTFVAVYSGMSNGYSKLVSVKGARTTEKRPSGGDSFLNTSSCIMLTAVYLAVYRSFPGWNLHGKGNKSKHQRVNLATRKVPTSTR